MRLLIFCKAGVEWVGRNVKLPSELQAANVTRRDYSKQPLQIQYQTQPPPSVEYSLHHLLLKYLVQCPWMYVHYYFNALIILSCGAF